MLDSSVVADLARDLLNTSARNHRDAAELAAALSSAHWIPTLSLLQVNEIAQHPDAGVVEDRIAFLQSLPRIAWVRNTMRSTATAFPYHGLILDLIFRESEAWQPGMPASQLCAMLRRSTFVTASDNSYIAPMVLDTARARRRLGSDQHSRRIASVASAIQRDVADITVAQARARMTRNPEAVAENLRRRLLTVRARVREGADPGVTYLEPFLQTKLEEMVADARAVVSSSGDPFVAYLALHNLVLDDVSDTDSMRDVGDLAALRSTMVMLLEDRTSARSSEERKRIRPRMLPSYYLDCLLRRKQVAKNSRPRGSDLHDASIAPMALYADLTLVDKRTQEALRQIRREQPDLDATMGRTMRWSLPSALLQALHSP